MTEATSDMERQVIGCALLAPETADASLLVPEDFSSAWSRRVWEGLLRLAGNGDPVSESTVSQETGVKASELADATIAACLPSQVVWYSKQIRNAAYRRRLVAVCSEAAKRLQAPANGQGDPLPDVVAGLVRALDEAPLGEQPRNLPHFVEQLIAEMPERRAQGKPGLSSGFPTLDHVTGGLRAGSLFVIAAATGVGKSLFAANVLLSAKVPAALFSLEMSGIEVAERMIAASAGVEAWRLQRGKLDPAELAELRERAEGHRTVWIDERPAPSVEEIGATARALGRREGVRLVIVDYLQIVRTLRDERREAEVASIARSLRALARSLRVPVIALAQLNRDGVVRDSAVIEHEAHVVAIFERKKGSSTATLEVRKNRHGPEESIALWFDKKTLRLGEVDA